MKKILSALLASTGLFCSAGTARIDLISGNAGLRVVSTAAGVSGKNMNWLPPEKAKRMLYFQQRNSCDEWSTMKFSFAADRDTTVQITRFVKLQRDVFISLRKITVLLLMPTLYPTL